MIVALDPSSERTGYAAIDEVHRLIVDAGYLRGERTADTAQTRILAMEKELAGLVAERKPSVILIEITKGKVNKKRHGGAGAGLATYGLAMGALWRTARDLVGDDRVVAIDEDWTRGVNKAVRARRIAMEFPQYRQAMELDRGGDAADAIGIALWWIGDQKRKGLVA